MEKQIKVTNKTYFKKIRIINIDDALGKNVLLEVNSPYNFGIRTFKYYGKILKVTNCYFYFLPYCEANFDYWFTNEILKKEAKGFSKKWAKKSIVSLYEISLKKNG